MEDIYKTLKDKIKNLREDIKNLISKKQNEIIELKKVDQNYDLLSQILAQDLPKTPEVINFWGLVGGTISDTSELIKDQFQAAMDIEHFSALISGTSASGLSAVMSNSTITSHLPAELIINISSKMSQDHKNKTKKIKDFLGKISTHLVDIYDAAHENLDFVSKDGGRGALGLMREIINQTLGILAPDAEIQKQEWYEADSTSRTGVTRKHRVRYIAEKKAKNDICKQIITNNIDLFDEVVNALNKFHKRGKLGNEEAEIFFYQTETSVEVICDCIKL